MSNRGPLGSGFNQGRVPQAPGSSQVNARAAGSRESALDGGRTGNAQPRKSMLQHVRVGKPKAEGFVMRSAATQAVTHAGTKAATQVGRQILANAQNQRAQEKQGQGSSPDRSQAQTSSQDPKQQQSSTWEERRRMASDAQKMQSERNKWKEQRAKWETEMGQRHGPELSQDIVSAVNSIDWVLENHQAITLVAQGIGNPSHSASVGNAQMWEKMIGSVVQGGGGGVVALVTNSNGMADAMNERTNAFSATAFAYVMSYALSRGATGENLVIGTHSNGVNTLDGALKILKQTHGRTLDGITILVVAPNCGVSKIYSIAGQLGPGSRVTVFDSVRDTALRGAGWGGKGVGFINYNHISRSTRPSNVSFFHVNIPATSLFTLVQGQGLNHEARHYFNAIAAGDFVEVR